MPERERNYRREYDLYQGTEQQKKNRAKRNAARRELMREGVVRKGDGLEVDHKRMIKDGGSNARSNLRAIPAARNRGWRDGKV